MTMLVVRIPTRVISGDDFAPWSTARKTVPKQTPANAASATERALARPDSSGPLVAIAPTSATTSPTACSDEGDSPPMNPATTGHGHTQSRDRRDDAHRPACQCGIERDEAGGAGDPESTDQGPSRSGRHTRRRPAPRSRPRRSPANIEPATTATAGRLRLRRPPKKSPVPHITLDMSASRMAMRAILWVDNHRSSGVCRSYAGSRTLDIVATWRGG